ncbi:putative START-like domain superfamily protein [Helianthus anomalus]
MFGTLSEETEVMVPASKAWALYGTLELAKLVTGKVVEAVEVVEGDGGDGSGSSCLVKLTLEYDVKEEFAANASLVTNRNLLGIMSVANEHLLKSN